MAWTELVTPAKPRSGETVGAAAPEPFLARLRRAELGRVTDVLQRHGSAPGCTVLEIGGGTGWQARDLAEAGYKVRSVDVETKPGVFPVELYDGHRLPCEDASCDVVFSSNVLEHVAHIEAFQAEMARVLKPGGIAVHLMPTPTWRLATSLAHYPWLLRAAFSVLVGKRDTADAADVAVVRGAAGRHGALALLRRVALSPRHGETGTVVSELWLFSPRRWTALFARHGWRVLEHRSNGLFYTGYNLLGSRLGLGTRRLLARALGGSCRVYVLSK